MTRGPLSDTEISETLAIFERNGRNVSRSAAELGISRSSFRGRLKTADRRRMLGDAPPARPFIAPELPSPDEPLESLLQRCRNEARRAIEADDARTLIPVKLTLSGPIGLFLQGDPHLDNPGRDFPALERDLALVERQPRILAMSCGDVLDNWVGRLEKLYGQSTVTAKDAWRLAEWMFTRPVNWLALSAGNHDAWSGHRDPLRYITKHRVPIYENAAARLALQHPCGAVTRVHMRHTFRGHSMYSALHGLRRETREGWRDHLLVAGHIHEGEDGAQINGDGIVSQMVRLSGYKRVDSFAKEHGFKSKPLHRSALAIIDPSKPESSRARVWLAPDIETGVDYLNYIAKRAA